MTPLKSLAVIILMLMLHDGNDNYDYEVFVDDESALLLSGLVEVAANARKEWFDQF